VSTDNSEIADISKQYGAHVICRPKEIATDTSSSEDALAHAIIEIEKTGKIDLVIFLQATSPVREKEDIDGAIEKLLSDNANSLFSASLLEDFCVWEIIDDELKSTTFDYKKRGRRQDRKPHYLENGSLYIFKPEILKQYNSRLGGKIVFYLMPMWKSYEIDTFNDIEVCEYYMKTKIFKSI
jgi:CMP-N,N'-diacetyllegionaminic acid synthase